MRKQRPRGTITREAVIDAALTIADHTGVNGVKIRAVAELVGAPPMSLYTHFANKSELLDLMYTEVARRMYVDSGHDTWQAELFALCLNVGRVLTQHPRWAELLARPAPAFAVPVRERVLKMMLADGLPAEDAARGLSGSMLTAIGLVLARLTMAGTPEKSAAERRTDDLRTLFDATPDEEASMSRRPEGPSTSHPPPARSGRFDYEDTSSFTLRALIAGLDARRAATAIR